MDVYRLIVVFVSCIFAANINAQIYQWVDENGQTQFSDKPPPSESNDEFQQSAESSDNELEISKRPIIVDHTGRYSEIQSGSRSIMLSLRKLLKENRFIELNQSLAGYYSAVESNISEEGNLSTAYESFDIPEWSYEQLYHAWANSTPDSYQPYLARAYYYAYRAWDARGTKWSAETSQESLDEMDKFFFRSLHDLDTALRLKPGLLPAYALKIRIANTQGEDQAEQEALEEGLEFYPSSFWLRSNYLTSITPRWGGSYEEMLNFVYESEPYFSQNSRLEMLYGYVLSDAADVSALSKAYTKSIELYTEALSFGKSHYVLAGRGESYYRKGEYDLAIADLDQAILLYDEEADYYYWRSRAYYQQKKYKKSLLDAERAAELKPLGSSIKSQLSRLKSVMAEAGLDSNVGRNLERELRELSDTIASDPNNAANYYSRARYFVERRQFDPAIEDLKKAIDLYPDNIAYYNLLDWCLLTKKDFEQIISYWDRYIYRHPKDGSAYHERSGTYHHKGDQTAAMRDLRKAAELGNPAAIRELERHKTSQ